MKKIAALLLCISVFTFSSCEDEPLDPALQTGPTSCELAILNSAEAALNFAGANIDNYTQICTVYRNALQAQIAICGDEDGSLMAQMDALGDCTDNMQQTAEVEGTWLLTAWIGEEGLDLNNDGFANLNFLEEMDCYTNETLVFNADGTATSTSNSYADIEYIVEMGNEESVTYTVDCIAETEVGAGTWIQAGNTVTITDTETSDSTDLTLDGNELSIFVPSGFFSSSEDGTSTTIQNLTFVYTKQ